MPKQTVGQISKSAMLISVPKSIPKEEYFVSRTRTRAFPLYREYRVIGRNYKTYWRNRWDGLYNKYHTDILRRLDEIKFEENETTITVTVIRKISGDIWKFQSDARNYLESKNGIPIVLVAVNEINGVVQFKGDYVDDLQQFLVDKGF